MTTNPMYDKLCQKVEAALIDNGGMDFDLMTLTEEAEVAEFIMSYIWPEIEKIITHNTILAQYGRLARYNEVSQEAYDAAAAYLKELDERLGITSADRLANE